MGRQQKLRNKRRAAKDNSQADPLADIRWSILPGRGERDATGDRILAYVRLSGLGNRWEGHIYPSDETPDGIGFFMHAQVANVDAYTQVFTAVRSKMADEFFGLYPELDHRSNPRQSESVAPILATSAKHHDQDSPVSSLPLFDG